MTKGDSAQCRRARCRPPSPWVSPRSLAVAPTTEIRVVEGETCSDFSTNRATDARCPAGRRTCRLGRSVSMATGGRGGCGGGCGPLLFGESWFFVSVRPPERWAWCRPPVPGGRGRGVNFIGRGVLWSEREREREREGEGRGEEGGGEGKREGGREGGRERERERKRERERDTHTDRQTFITSLLRGRGSEAVG